MNLPALTLTKQDLERFDESLRREWLVTNGIGGYASSTVLGINTRKYHGLLVAAMHPPGDRTVCLSKLDEEIQIGNECFLLGANEFKDTFFPNGYMHLITFSVSPLPTYTYSVPGVHVQKTISMPEGKNETVIVYKVRNEGGSQAKLKILPLVSFRHYHAVSEKSKTELKISQNQMGTRDVALGFQKSNEKKMLNIRSTAGEFTERPNWIERILFREDAARGESSIEDCYQPGAFEFKVRPLSEEKFALAASAYVNYQAPTEQSVLDNVVPDYDTVLSLELERQNYLVTCFFNFHTEMPDSNWLKWILLAADSFLVRDVDRRKAVIAGYHWYEPWGRDTFISLPGLLLVPSRFDDARDVLANFGEHCKHGLIPNFLSDKSGEAAYNSVDASLWYINAVFQYLKYTGDFAFVKTRLWQSLKEIIENHIVGTSFGIRVDDDGLIMHGPRLTWMDAEVNGKAITPRAGKAVEIQALWYNALRTVRLLATTFEEKALTESCTLLAEKAKANFPNKFWNEERNCLFDVLTDSEPDVSVRPNQVIVASLDFTLLDSNRNERIVDMAMNEFLTPCGLRTLERNDPRYKGAYLGDRWNRDQAYHNGTVWPWLLGPFTKAFLKTRGYSNQSREYALKNFIEPLFNNQIGTGGLGTISEIFDGDLPHNPRGCISQAWSVAEPLRVYVEDVLLIRPRFEQQLLSVKSG